MRLEARNFNRKLVYAGAKIERCSHRLNTKFSNLGACEQVQTKSRRAVSFCLDERLIVGSDFVEIFDRLIRKFVLTVFVLTRLHDTC